LTTLEALLRDSDRILDLVVVHTPGHTDGSISLYREKMAIFVGDALRTDSTGNPHLPSGSMTVNMEQAKESVRKISSLQYAILLPGHGLSSPRTRQRQFWASFMGDSFEGRCHRSGFLPQRKYN
jgi:hydroxyacylglutathione hydrolase